MKVSIVIPCHNAAPYLAQTIGSALDQHCPPHEVIVVDDASTDGSLDIARRFETARPTRVQVCSVRSMSASRTRNVGAYAAQGDALMFLDADDVLAPDALAALAAALARQPEGVAICPWYRLELVGGQWLERPSSCTPRRAGQDALSAWLTGWYHPPCSVLWSRTAFEQAGRWDERWSVNDDGDLMMRALASHAPLVEATGGAAYYRRLPEGEPSLSGARVTVRGLYSRFRTVEKIAAWLAQQGMLDQYSAPLRSAYALIAADARGRESRLCEQAAAAARRHYQPSWIRAVHRSMRTAMPRSSAPAVPQECRTRQPITFGLATADVVLASSRPRQAMTPPPVRPVVSVVIPAFNRAQLLPRTLASVRAQTFDAFEILVIDDGSADDTAAVVTACGDPRVRYLQQPRNMGVSAARNRGLREARGDFIAFLDSDDEWMPEKVERQVALFRRLPEHVGLLYTGVQSVREDGTTTIEQPGDRGDVHREMLWHNVIHGGGSNVMIRRNVVATIGFFHEGLPAIEDYEYWLRITRAYAVDFVPEPLIRYHDRRDTMRRSLSWRANVDARWWLYRRHAPEMRRAGVAHLFLLNTIRWAMNFPGRDLGEVRRLAARAVLDAPTSRMAVAMLLRTMLPAAGRLPWVQRHAALE